jgi:hypothetical protein
LKIPNVRVNEGNRSYRKTCGMHTNQTVGLFEINGWERRERGGEYPTAIVYKRILQWEWNSGVVCEDEGND